jgi:hypothetical protein
VVGKPILGETAVGRPIEALMVVPGPEEGRMVMTVVGKPILGEITVGLPIEALMVTERTGSEAGGITVTVATALLLAREK